MAELVGETVTTENGNQYKIMGFLGAGAFGQIFEVQSGDNQPLAMKIHRNIEKELHQVETDMMELVAKKAKSKNIVKMHEFGDLKNEKSTNVLCDRYIIMDLLGPSIFQVLDSEHPACFENSDIIQIGYQVCSAMEYLESLKILHLDLKPENICFVKIDNSVKSRRIQDQQPIIQMENTQIRLIDFGTARRIDKRESKDSTRNQMFGHLDVCCLNCTLVNYCFSAMRERIRKNRNWMLCRRFFEEQFLIICMKGLSILTAIRWNYPKRESVFINSIQRRSRTSKRFLQMFESTISLVVNYSISFSIVWKWTQKIDRSLRISAKIDFLMMFMRLSKSTDSSTCIYYFWSFIAYFLYCL